MRWLLAAVVVCAWGCGGGPPADGGISFAVGGAPAEVDYWEQLAREFTAATDIPVQVRRQPTDSDLRRQELVIALRAKQPDPDVFLMDVAWVPQFAAVDALEPLGDRARESGLDLNAFFQGVVRLADHYQSHLVALPVYVDAGLLYYRPDILAAYGYDEPPQTWAELVDSAERIQVDRRANGDGDFEGFVWQGAQYEGLMCTFLEFAVSNGGGIRIRGDRLELDTPANRRALQLMHDLIHKINISPPNTYTTMKEEEVRAVFQQGEALYERNWPYAWALHQAQDSPVRGKVAIAPLPHGPHGGSAATLGGWHVGISRFSDAKPEAWRFVRYVASYDVQKALALHLGWNPGRKDVYTDEDVLAKLPHLASLREVFENATPRPTVPYYAQLSAVVQRHLNAALAGEVTPAVALRDAEAEAQRIVDRYAGGR